MSISRPALIKRRSTASIRQTYEGEHHDDFGEVPVPFTFAIMAFVISASINSCSIGYELGTSTKIGDVLREELEIDEDQRRIFIHSLNVFAMLGASYAWYISDKYGRRMNLILSSVFSIIGQLVTASAHSFHHLMLGRLIVGMGLGLGLMVAPLYIAELAPAKYRGFLVAWSELARTCGLIVGYNSSIILNGLPDWIQWRLMVVCACILPLISIWVTLYILPESPRYLIAWGRHDEARAVLFNVYGPSFEIEPIVESIEDSLHRDVQTLGAAAASSPTGPGKGSPTNNHGCADNDQMDFERMSTRRLLMMLFCSPHMALGRMVLVGLLAGVAQQALGYNALHYYIVDVVYHSTPNIQKSKFADLVLIALSTGSIFCIFVGGKLLDTRGRRPLLLFSSTACGAILILFSFTFFGNNEPSSKVKIMAIVTYFLFHSVGLGPGAVAVATEAFPISIRAKALSAATSINQFFAVLVSILYPTLARQYGWESVFMLFGLLSLAFAAVFHMLLPETKNRSLELMPVYFAEITGDTRTVETEVDVAMHRLFAATSRQPYKKGNTVEPHECEII